MSRSIQWNCEPLRNFIQDMGDGGTPSRAIAEYFGGDIPWVVITDVEREIKDTNEYLTEKGLSACTAKLWPSGSIILSTGATIGKVGIAQVPVATKQGITGLIPNKRVTSKFLYYKLASKTQQLNAWAQGSTFSEIRVPILSKVLLEVPESIGVQNKISAILQNTDEVIEKTAALIEKYQKIKAGLMHDLFTRGIGADGKLRPPREQAPELYQETQIGWIPKEWSVQSIRSLIVNKVILDIQDGNHGELHPKKEDFVEEGIPFIMASDIADGIIDIENSYRITEAQYHSLRIGFAKAGDVLLSHKASIGFVAMVPNEVDRLMLTPQVTYYRISGSEISPEYLCSFMRSDQFQIPLKSLAQQSTRDYIGILAQQKLYLAYPKTAYEQEQIANRTSTIIKKIEEEKRNLKKLVSLKHGLMHDLLTGKVEVKADYPKAAHV